MTTSEYRGAQHRLLRLITWLVLIIHPDIPHMPRVPRARQLNLSRDQSTSRMLTVIAPAISRSSNFLTGIDCGTTYSQHKFSRATAQDVWEGTSV